MFAPKNVTRQSLEASIKNVELNVGMLKEEYLMRLEAIKNSNDEDLENRILSSEYTKQQLEEEERIFKSGKLQLKNFCN